MKIRIKFLLTGIVIFFILGHVEAQTDSAAVTSQIITIEQALANALPVDSTVWSNYLDKNWHIVDEDGNVSTRKEFLATFKPLPKEVTLNVTVTRPVFSFHENMVVIQYVADEHESTYGQQLHTTYGTMDVWYKTGEKWTMLSMQDFEIPALPPAIKISALLLEKYVGIYQLIKGKTAIVSLKNDTLYLQKGSGKAEVLFAETDNIFFKKSDSRGRKLFVTDEYGKMLMLERRNGQDVSWTRINVN